MREAQGRYCLLLNEDSELQPGRGRGAARGARRRPRGRGGRRRSCSTPTAAPVPCAWRFPGVGTALAGALFLHRWLHRAEQGRARPGGSTGRSRARCWSAARRPPRSTTWTPPSSSTTTSATSPSASPTPAGTSLFVPGAEAVHHDQLSTDLAAGPAADRRIPPQPRPLHAKAPRARGGPRRPPAHRLVLRACAPSPPPSSPASPPRSTGPTPARRSSRAAARVIRDRSRNG